MSESNPSSASKSPRRRMAGKLRKLSLGLNNRDNDNTMTEERQNILKESWALIVEKYGMYRPGLLIFKQIFTFTPELLPVFGFPNNYPLENLENLEEDSTQFRHGRIFTNVLNISVRNSGCLDSELAPILHIYGRRHFSKHHLELRNDHMMAFARGITAFVLEEVKDLDNCEDIMTSWKILIGFILNKLREGYQLEQMGSKNGASHSIFRRSNQKT